MQSIQIANYRVRHDVLEVRVEESIYLGEDVFFQFKHSTKQVCLHKATITNSEIGVMLSLPLSEVFYEDMEKDIIEICLMDSNREIYQLILNNLPLKEIAARYSVNSYWINYKMSATPYITMTDTLALIYGNSIDTIKDQAIIIDSKVTALRMDFTDNTMKLTLPEGFIDSSKGSYVTMVNRRTKKTSILKHDILRYEDEATNQSHVIAYFDHNLIIEDRYDLYMQFKIGKRIRRVRVGIVESTIEYGENKYYQTMNLNSRTNLLPYITTNGEVSFFVGNALSVDTATGKKIEKNEIRIADISQDGNILKVHLNTGEMNRLNSYDEKTFLIRNDINGIVSELSYNAVKIGGNEQIHLNLSEMFEGDEYKEKERWTFLVKLQGLQQVDAECTNAVIMNTAVEQLIDSINEVSAVVATIENEEKVEDTIVVAEFVKISNWIQESSERYKAPIEVSEHTSVITYLSNDNKVMFLIGNEDVYKEEICKRISTVVEIEDIVVTYAKIRFRFIDEQIIKENNFRIYLKERITGEIWNIEYGVNTDNSVVFEINDFVENNILNESRWDTYVQHCYFNIIEVGKIGLFSEPVKSTNLRYFKSIEIFNSEELEQAVEINVVTPYLTVKNELSFVIRPEVNLFNEKFNKRITRVVAIEDIVVTHTNIHFRFVDEQIIKDNNFRIYLKERITGEIWTVEYGINTDNSIVFKIDDFVEKYISVESRWDTYVQHCYLNIVEEGKIGLFNEPVKSTNLRYFKSIEKLDIEESEQDESEQGLELNVVTPYLTVKNELSFVIRPEVNLFNEKYRSKVSITEFEMNKGIVKLTSRIELFDCPIYTIRLVKLKLRNKAVFQEYSIDAKESKISDGMSLVVCTIDLTQFRFQPFYWDIYIVVNIGTEDIYVKLKNPTTYITNEVNSHTLKYEYLINKQYMIYPYITQDKSISFCYRERASYEGVIYKIKEKLAYYIYRLLRGHYDKRNIWLAYEKFSSTAQDNGYHFFNYCYQNNKHANFYYVIKADSTDYHDLQHQKNKVLKFMSFKYMVYMYAAKLLVSSESKGHSYDIRIQKGRLKAALDRKKFVFLQHGVTALKKVDYVFKKTKHNAVDLFVTTSEYEKDIIKNNFGYHDNEIIVTGFCRWDVLEDKSSDESKRIFIMPTWRSWMDGIPEEDFVQTDYYNNYMSLLQSSKLQRLLEDNDVKINFLLHPKFMEHVNKFKIENENIEINQFGELKVNEMLMSASMLITDYSSVSWDMYYQGKPTVFFQFDVDKYNKFQGSYLDMETELFGDRALTINELLTLITKYIDRDFKEDEKHRLMREKYFKYVDNKNSERTFQAIVENKNLGYQKKTTKKKRSIYNILRKNVLLKSIWRLASKSNFTKSILIKVRNKIRS